jgi:hypothetical protein
LRNEKERKRKEILGRQEWQFGLVILHHLYWEIQLAVQIFRINFHFFVYETIHQRRQLVCLHRKKRIIRVPSHLSTRHFYVFVQLWSVTYFINQSNIITYSRHDAFTWYIYFVLQFFYDFEFYYQKVHVCYFIMNHNYSKRRTEMIFNNWLAFWSVNISDSSFDVKNRSFFIM